VEFVAGDIFESTKKLGADGSRFDLIFSNHVIEHFYDPDEQISELCSLLKPGGRFTAGVPLDAYPFSDLLAARSRDPQSTNALDMDWLDLRHPWKTNEADLARTLRGAGMGSVVLFRRTHHANNSKCEDDLSLEGCTQRERRARRIESLTVQPWIGAMKLLFGRNPPRRLARLVFGVNRRLWFGRYRLKCDIQPEVFATAVRKAEDPGHEAGRNGKGTAAFSAGADAY
jgi:2-polyprenyl-3-methyl-5-hydroxy-6-metoxy-1,4-benzoquinol methylase